MANTRVTVNLYPSGRVAAVIRGQVVQNGLLPRVRRVETLARSFAPVDTGRLRASIRTRARAGGGQFASTGGTGIAAFEVVAAVPYAGFVEDGTRPHIIRVRNASVLTNGVNFFGKEVRHPGTRARKFMSRALIVGMR